ncbi:MAG: pentapeptide repeat-containing protein [Anaerolineae bacterium]|nr:pentapeptide repeat-containing protein [Anaerolineae bacterium]
MSLLYIVLAFGVFVIIGGKANSDRCATLVPGAYLQQCDLRQDTLSGTDLNGTDLTRADLSETDLTDVNLSEAVLTGANLSGAVLVNADLSGADLTGADLSETDLTDVSLSGAVLTRVNLSGALLVNADLSGLDLTGADLTDVTLSRADLTGANLSEADLSGADLTGSILEGARLDMAGLFGGVGITDEMLSSLGSWRGLLLESSEYMAEQLSDICAQNVYSVSEDVWDDNFHPLVWVPVDVEHDDWSVMIPREWWPGTSQLAELVACVEEGYRLVEVCGTYGGVTISRYQHRVRVQLFQASTGDLIESIALEGTSPDSCPLVTSDRTQRRGDRVSEEDRVDLLATLAQYVNPSGERSPLTVVDAEPGP